MKRDVYKIIGEIFPDLSQGGLGLLLNFADHFWLG